MLLFCRLLSHSLCIQHVVNVLNDQGGPGYLSTLTQHWQAPLNYLPKAFKSALRFNYFCIHLFKINIWAHATFVKMCFIFLLIVGFWAWTAILLCSKMFDEWMMLIITMEPVCGTNGAASYSTFKVYIKYFVWLFERINVLLELSKIFFIKNSIYIMVWPIYVAFQDGRRIQIQHQLKLNSKPSKLRDTSRRVKQSNQHCREIFQCQRSKHSIVHHGK